MTNIPTGTNPAETRIDPLEALRMMRILLGYAADFIQNAKGAANDGGHADYLADIDVAATHVDSLIIEVDTAIAAEEKARG